MTGYFKGELRPCPFCGETDFIKVRTANIECENCHTLYFAMFDNPIEVIIEGWNTRPAFDEAIDVIMFQITDGVFTGPNTHEAFIETLEKITGLTYDEALKIYQKRQEEKAEGIEK